MSFAILDELLSKERLKTLTIKEAVSYRKASDDARRAFLEHISVLQKKQGEIAGDCDYAGEIRRIVDIEIVPAVRIYRNVLKKIDDGLVGAIGKGVVGAMGGSSFIQLFGDLSLVTLLPVAGAATAYVVNALVDTILARRAVQRECSLSYILSLE